MDAKLNLTLDKILLLIKQNPEFDSELRKALELEPSEKSAFIDDERINQIYEYCIEMIIRKQAQEFYSNLPLKDLVPDLVEDFVRMEAFRRKDNFGDFCLSLYQQIECITNKLCSTKVLSDITEKMWACSAYVKVEKGKEPNISERTNSDYTIASLAFPGNNKKTGMPNSFEKSRSALQTQYAMDKVRSLVYFLGYKAIMKSSDYDAYIEISSSLNDIYQCRNMNHRGNTQTKFEQETLDRILPLKSFYYFKFMGILAQYINYINTGYQCIPAIEKYANSLTDKKVNSSGLKIIGKIDLSTISRK